MEDTCITIQILHSNYQQTTTIQIMQVDKKDLS